MLIFWRVKFEGDGLGYLVFRSDLGVVVGLYNDAGHLFAMENVNYTTIDAGENPLVGVTPPDWAGQLQ